MSTHVSLGGIAARTISLSLGDRGEEENDQEEDFPATSKQMTDHRPGGSLSTAPDVNEMFCEQQLPCQSVHHPLHQVSFHHTHSDVRREGRKKQSCVRNFEPLPFLLVYISFIPKDSCRRISARISPLSPTLGAFSHSARA